MRLAAILPAALGVLMLAGTAVDTARAQTAAPSRTAIVAFGGVDYVHRWSRAGQHEFTPRGQEDLDHWRDMVTIDVHEAATNGDQLAEVANRVLGNYQSRGKIVRTDSRPRTAQRPAEHLVVALFAGASAMEAGFARFVLVDGTGVVVVYSRRFYGRDAASAMADWLQANGPAVERTLMSWDGIPAVGTLKGLPQSR